MSAQPFDAVFSQVADRLNGIDRRLDSLEQRSEIRFAQIDSRFGQLAAQMDQRFNWLTGIVVATWITTILTILFHR
ncbi:MAG: hypothetical protein JO359_06275 [Candidatus Eremiobacteraeota bacterium]|nr:hypothetical protein [Candidatus Eremiobacteraeota bacterium]